MNERARQKLDEARGAIRAYLRLHYSYEQLCATLAHARDGRLSYRSCCCIVGIPTADHPLKGRNPGEMAYSHLASAYTVFRESFDVDYAFLQLGALGRPCAAEEEDARRRRRLIPILLGEIRRRSTTPTRNEEHSRAENLCV